MAIYIECCYAECRVHLNAILNVIMVSVVILNVVMLSVVAPGLFGLFKIA